MGKTTSSDPLTYIKRSLRLVFSLYIIEIYKVPDVVIVEKILLRTQTMNEFNVRLKLFGGVWKQWLIMISLSELRLGLIYKNKIDMFFTEKNKLMNH